MQDQDYRDSGCRLREVQHGELAVCFQRCGVPSMGCLFGVIEVAAPDALPVLPDTATHLPSCRFTPM